MTKETTTKNNNFNLIYYILAVTCVTAFFAYEFLPNQSNEFLEAKSKHVSLKKERSVTLNQIKSFAVGTNEYEAYLKKKSETDIAWDELKEVVNNERFLNFDNLQQFLGEFGWAFGLFIYTLFNLIMTLSRRRSSLKGEVVLHTTLLFISLYFINWCIMPQDYSKQMYFVFAFVMAIGVSFATYLLILSKLKHFNSLMDNIKDLVGFMFNHTKPESEDQMWNVLKNIKHDR